MRIVLIVNLFPPKWLAGTEIATYNIAKYLAKKGNEIHVITLRDEMFPKREKLDNFFVHRVDFKKIRLIGVISLWISILVKIKEIDPDMIHIQAISIAIPGLLSKIFLKKPYIVWGRGSDVYLPDKFTKLTSKMVLNNASAVIALNEDMKIKMSNICKKDEIVILPNGIELEKFKDIYLMEQESIKKTIIFVGTLKSVKGVKYLIKAMKIITEKSPDTSLLIVGDGQEKEKLETLVQELNLQNSIRFAGKVTNEQIPKYMAQADLFVLPSLSEGFPLVVVEAMASGLPIVTTNVRGLPEIVQNGENGFNVEPKNPEDLAEKILLILESKDLREKMSKKNLIKANEYTWDRVVDELIKVYISALLSKVRN